MKGGVMGSNITGVPRRKMRRIARGWGWRRLPVFKTVNGKLWQLHATRGWKPA